MISENDEQSNFRVLKKDYLINLIELIRDSYIYFLKFVFIGVSGFLFWLLVSRTIPSFYMGLAVIAQSYGLFLSTFAMMGFGGSLPHLIAGKVVKNDTDGIQKIITTSYLFVTAISMIFLTLTATFSRIIATIFYKTPQFAFLLILGSLLTLFYSISTINAFILLGLRKPKFILIDSLIYSSLKILLFYIFDIETHSSAMIVIILVLASFFSALTSLLLISKGLSTFPLTIRLEINTAKILFKNSIILTIWNISYAIMSHGGILLLGVFFPQHADLVAYYFIAYMFSGFIFLIGHSVSANTLPMISQAYETKEFAYIQDLVSLSLRVAFLILMPFFVVFVAKPYLVLGLYGSEYISAANVLAILSLAAPLLFIINISYACLVGTNKPEKTTYVAIAMSLSFVFLSLLLLPKYSSEGLAISLLSSYAIGSIMILGLIKDYISFQMLRKSIKILISLGTVSFIVFLVPINNLYIITGITSVLSIISLTLTGIISRDKILKIIHVIFKEREKERS